MRFLKKVPWLVLVLALCISLLSSLSPTASAAVGMQFTIKADKTEVNPGDEVKFTVTAEGTEPCDQIGLIFQFDRDVFEFVKGAAQASYLDEYEEEVVGVKSFSKAAGKEGIAISFLEAVTYSGKVGYITLKVKEDANFSTAALTAILAVNRGADSVAAAINEAAISMIPAETQTPPEPAGAGIQFRIEADKTVVKSGDEVKFDVYVESTEAVDQFGLIFEFDRDIFEFVKGAAQATYIDENEKEVVNVKTFNKSEGKEGIAVSFLEAVVYNGKAGYITLKVKDDAMFESTSFTARTASNIGSDAVEASINVVEITMEHVHAWTEVAAVEPTYHTDGNIAYKYCKCGEAWTLGENSILLNKDSWILPATVNHTLEHHDAIAATCDQDGHEAYDYCKDCQVFIYEDPLKLSFQDGVIPALEHTWVDYPAVEPTCDTEGNIAYQQCSVCGAAQTVGENPVPLSKYGWILGATGHTWTEYAAIEPSCDTEGNIAYQQCSVCGAAQTVGENPIPLSKYAWVLGALGHTWVEHEAVEPTCDTEGNIAYQQCSVCGAAQTVGENPMPLGKYGWILGVTGHDWVDYSAVEPTCTAEGNIAYQLCNVCGAAQTAGENPQPLSKDGWVLDRSEHNVEHIAAKAATIETDGCIEHWRCTACDGVWLDEALTEKTYISDVIISKLSGTCGDNLSWRIEEDTLIVSGTGEMYGEYAVMVQPWMGHYFTTAVFESGVTSIGDLAFDRNSNLQCVYIPKTVTTIADGAFEECYNLRKVYYEGAENQWQVIEIGFGNEILDGARFIYNYHEHIYENNRCTICGLQDIFVEIGTCGANLTWTLDRNGVVTISGTGPMTEFDWDESPWWRCADVKSVVIEKGVTSIGSHAFSTCENLQSVKIPNGVTSIGRSAFDNCLKLTSVVIPDSVTKIDMEAFFGCRALEELVIGNGVTSIGFMAFYFCSSLQTVRIPDSVTEMGTVVFGDCTSLQEVIFGNGLITIPFLTFENCKALQSVTIPSSVTAIGIEAFGYCSNLQNVYYTGTEESWKMIVIGNRNETLKNANIIYVASNAPTGDTNGDDVVSNNDVLALLWYTLFPEQNAISGNADFTGDGLIDNADVLVLLWHCLFPENNPL